MLVEDSAAQYHGWELKHRPSEPHIAVPRNRKVEQHRRRGVTLRYVTLADEDVSRLATVPGATVMACAARMPFDEALAVADSALRRPTRSSPCCGLHGRRRQLKADCERYNAFVLAGWRVLRFSWEHVMFEPGYFRQVLLAAVQPLGRALPDGSLRRSA